MLPLSPIEHVRVRGCGAVATVIAREREARAGAAVDRVRAVGALVRGGQAEEVGAAADQVVLAEPAVQGVAAAVALEVVRPLAAVQDVVAQLAEDQVVAGPGVDHVVAGEPRKRGGGVVEDRDRAHLDRIRVELGGAGDAGAGVVGLSRRVEQVEPRPDEHPDEGAERRTRPKDLAVVAHDHVVAGASIDEVTGVAAAGDVVTADDVVVAVGTADRVRALLAEDDVGTGVAVQAVVAAVGVGRVDGDERERMDRHGQRQLSGVRRTSWR